MSESNALKKWSFFLKSQPDAEDVATSKSTNDIIQDADKYYAYLASAETGFYPLGQHGVWHGGIHFDYASLLHYRRSIHCLADGEVVATRINDKYLSMVEGANFPYISSGFALIRHRLELPSEPPAEQAAANTPSTGENAEESASSSTPASAPPSEPSPPAETRSSTPENTPQSAEASTARPSLTFYSLYMHMFPWAEYCSKELALPSFWGTSHYQSKKSKSTDRLLGVRMRPLAKGKNNAVDGKKVLCVVVRGSVIRLGEELPGNAKWRKVEEVVSGKAYPERDGETAGYAYVDELTKVEGQEGQWFVSEKAKDAPEETSAKTIRGVYIRETADKKSKILALLQREKKVTLGEVSGDYSKLKTVEAEEATIPALSADKQGVLPGWIETDSLEKISTVPDKFNVVNLLEPSVAIKAGEVVGYPGGMDLKEIDGGWIGEFPLLHLEVFSGDDVPAFMAKSRALEARLPDSHKTMLQISTGTILVQPTAPDTKIFANVDVNVEPDSPKDGEWAKVKCYYTVKVIDKSLGLGTYDSKKNVYSINDKQKADIADSAGISVEKVPDEVIFLEKLSDNNGKARLIGFSPKEVSPCWIARTGLNEQQRRAEMGSELSAWTTFPLQQQSAAGATAKNSVVGYTRVLTPSQMKEAKKASDGKAVWWNVSANNDAGDEIRGWVKEGEGATRCSPWAWPGFECIEEQSKPSEQAARNDVEGPPRHWGDREEFERYESAKKADRGSLLQKLYDIIDCQEQKDGKLTVSEYQKALSKPWLAKQLSRLIVNYESEWHADEGLSKWEALFKLKDPENEESAYWDMVRAKIRALIWYKEVMGKLGLPESGRVWHFHPVGLVESFSQSSVDNISPWMEIAYKEEGVYERDRENGGFERVKLYYKDGAGQKLDPIKKPWCASFANWVLVETNRVKDTSFSYIPRNSEINNPAMAINFVNKERYPGGRIIPADQKPPYGAILIIKSLNSHQGHATFVVNYTENSDGFTIVGFGGNQDHKVKRNSYQFKKDNGKYIYNNNFQHMGYVIPKEYKFDQNDERYYRYENTTADESNSLT